VRFTEFLEQAKKKTFWKKQRVICFSGYNYPIFLFRTLFTFLKEKDAETLSLLTIETKKQLWESLEQCFLGGTSFYWLGNITQTIKKAPDLIEVLSLYRGPHSIAFFLPDDYKISVSARKRMTMVDMTNACASNDVLKLLAFFDINLTQNKFDVLLDVIKNSDTLSLDNACILFHYLSVTSVRLLGLLRKNLAAIISPERSLFSLSSAFFKKQERTFFSLWLECCNDYTIPFWTVYWSEQVWRAYYVVTFLKQNNFPAARRFAFRLPSSFIRYDWRNCNLSQLRGAYQMLYDIDFAFKTGSSVTQGSTLYSLDLFYCTYFLKRFS